MKIRPVGAELFHEDRRTDMAKLIVAFHTFADSPKNNFFIITNLMHKFLVHLHKLH
jgi:hypothetical protein